MLALVIRKGVFVRNANRWTAARLPFHWIMPLAFLGIGLLYLYASPNFEASDSIAHVGMIKWIADHGELPVQTPEHEHLYGQEGSQPPLYYALMAAIWRALEPSDFAAYLQQSPLALAGVPERLGSRNLVFYQQPYPPQFSGTSLTLYVIRFVTLAMGAVTVAAVYQSARTVMPDHKGFAVLAMSLTAFNPMYIFNKRLGKQ